jgi:hypothetical protein
MIDIESLQWQNSYLKEFAFILKFMSKMVFAFVTMIVFNPLRLRHPYSG